MAFNSLKSKLPSGTDTSDWPADITSPYGQAWLAKEKNEAMFNNDTAKNASKMAEDTYNNLQKGAQSNQENAEAMKAKAEAGIQPSIATRNLAEANKYNADAMKARQEGVPNAGNMVAGVDITGVHKLSDVPPRYQGVVSGLSDGTIQINSLPSRTSPTQLGRTDALALAKAINPNYDERIATQTNKTITDYAPQGYAGKQIGSLGAIAEHTQMLRSAQAQLAQGNIPALNSMANSLGASIGNSPKNTYDNMLNVYSEEVGKNFSGNNPTEGGARRYASNLSSNMSPQQAKAAFDTLDTAVVGKLQPFDQAYFNASGKHLTDTNLLTPAAKGLISKAQQGNQQNNQQGQQQMSRTKVNPANNKTYYLHPDGNYYLAPAGGQ